jgi:zinc transporter ZupT
LSSSFLGILFLFSALAMAGAVAGVYMSSVPDVSRRIVPISGAVLLVISLLLVLPELVERFGLSTGSALMLAGVAAIWATDRFIHPVCPACSHTHDHDACSTRLHGFATPLIIAALLHSVFDGWVMVAGDPRDGIGGALAAGVLVHKIPESFAYGVILRAAMRSRQLALGWALGAQAATIVGALLALSLAPVLGSTWISVLLALGGGMFLYLGFHAVHGEWKRRSAAKPVQIS